ncbi:glycine cleavage system protein GcvH [Beggiatoa leptomitoformis]|uniref:Glycine cleavage system H protein n=1 Tax=Beggiatoa leptomitoformis TaxID=288004 RepID=A0A2N9YFM4_9GAMM|nr:glycine cleavage system protein GcvH [Beggiatoa leptomitoformis]ALG68504.1 glycine cleavage system protein GcvH [Beggiatoa leptomitoformis]AUI69159.1 glycine cleavage system protein GcvH [Beggiatoa leptomitoformis]
MSEILDDLKYASSHEWVRIENDVAIIGITDHAQQLLGDLVFIELPEIGQPVDAGDECAVVESVKAASDVYSPVGGEVIAVNASLVDEPELVNKSPYYDGWLFKVRLSDGDAGLDDLLSAEEYSENLEAEH